MKKFIAEQYYFPGSKDYPWFIVTVCEGTGTVDIQSDHGDWQHRWSSLGLAGRTLKQFLIADRFSSDYFKDKFGYDSLGRTGANNWFDSDTTVENIKNDIKKYFNGKIPEDWEIEIDELESMACCKTNQEFYFHMPEKITTTIYEGDPHKIPFMNTTHPQLVAYMEKCWPVFIDYLRKEMEGNNVQSQS